jgi:hypothetical protein
MENAAGPDSLTTAIALRPEAVDRATIVSSSPGSGVRTILVGLEGSMLEHMAGFQDANIRAPAVRGQ